MGIVSYLHQDTGITDYDPNMKASERLQNRLPTLAELRKYKKILQNVFEEKQNTGYTPDLHCPLFLGTSSIRRSGWGVFAGKNYEPGDEIMITGSWPHWITIMNDGEDQTSSSSPDNNENSTCTSSSTTTTTTTTKFPTYSFLLKPHTILHNAEWKEVPATEGNYPKLVATTNISTAEEIFLNWEQHPYQTFQHLFDDTLPRQEHFEKANNIIQDARKVFKLNRGHNVQKRRLPGITEGLMMLRRGIFRYDALVATLLPRTADELLLYKTDTSTSEVYSLDNQTIATLSSTGRCMTNVEWKNFVQKETVNDDNDEHNPSDSNLNYVLSKDFVGEGDLIMPIPLLLQQTTLDGEANKSVKAITSSLSCFELKNSVALCPLTKPIMITNNPDIANAKYEWSANSGQHKKLLDSIINSESADETPSLLSSLQPLSMSWDLVALRDIVQDEAVSQSVRGLFTIDVLPFFF